MTGGVRRAWLRERPGGERFLLFERPLERWTAAAAEEVPPLLARVETAAAAGRWVVGFVGYEAAPAFDSALAVHPPRGPAPLAAFSVFDAPAERARPRSAAVPRLSPRVPTMDPAAHARAVAAVRAAIAEGATYQVNLCFALEGECAAEPEALFFGLLAAGEAPQAALLEGDGWALVSLSPELFFERSAGRLTMRPMKGTRSRGRFAAEDRRLAAELAASAKERAENLMIVDMVRNDLGRVAEPGSVALERAFAVERYPTVWQLTSTVTAASRAALPELFGALFPCASVTGAPKPATMGLIRRLEGGPRGAYCGAIGAVAPGGEARFAVAIRTIELDLARGRFRYGVGGGVTWDSVAADEWRECLDKSRVLDGAPPPFALLETMRWRSPAAGADEARGIELIDLHLERLGESAEHFGWIAPGGRAELEQRAREAIRDRSAELGAASHRLRLTLTREGGIELEARPFEPDRHAWRVAISSEAVDSRDPFLFHKTTRRERYERALAGAGSAADEVLQVNEHGELTEGTRTNLFVQLRDEWLTPPREAGLLAGVFRERLLRAGRVVEATLYPRDLARAHRIRLGNALRGWIAVARPIVDAAGRPLG